MLGHRAIKDEVAGVVETLTQAFDSDPVWSWAIPDAGTRRERFASLWRVFVDSAIDGGWVWTTRGCSAVAVWNPPGVEDLDEEGARRLESVIDVGFGTGGSRMREVLESFSDHRPSWPDHFYLNMLGVRTADRGRGLGMALLAENLLSIDALGAPAYLESSNPLNQARYEAVGFEAVETFKVAGVGPSVTTMWRDPMGTGGRGETRPVGTTNSDDRHR
jgi:GNAT superfamily N-acetyltransferase